MMSREEQIEMEDRDTDLMVKVPVGMCAVVGAVAIFVQVTAATHWVLGALGAVVFAAVTGWGTAAVCRRFR